MLRSFLTITLILSTLAPVAGQQLQPPRPQKKNTTPTPQEDVERVNINLVQFDVVVTDKNGQQVTDLRPEEIEVLENGKRQQITNFSYINTAPMNASPAAAGTAQPARPAVAVPSPRTASKDAASPVAPARLRREQTHRTVALVVDDLGLSFESIGFVRKALKKFVDEQMQPGDLVAIMRTSGDVGALQQFTTDKRQLYAAIERVRWYPGGRGGLSPFAPVNDAVDDIKQSTQVLEELEEARAGQYAIGTLGTLGFVVRGLRDLPGRKSVVLFSEAFRLFTAQGRNTQLVDALRRLTDQANLASTVIYTIDASGLQALGLNAADKAYGATFLFDPGLLGLAPGPPPRGLPPRADAAPGRVDAGGDAERDSGSAFRRLHALMDQRRDQHLEAQSVLSYLAHQTGGLFVGNQNDLSSGLQRLLDDQKGYYLIGYRPADSSIDPATGNRRFRSLSVKVKRAGGLKLRARSGFYGISDEERQPRSRTREEQLVAALVSPFAAGDVRLRLTSLFGTSPTDGPFMRSLLHVDTRDLSFTKEADGSHKADMEVIAVNFGDNGRVVDQYNYAQTIRVQDDEYQRLLRQGLPYIINIPIKQAGAYQLRVAVRDVSSARIGAASQFVEVPNLSKNRLALSGIVLSGIELATITKTAAAPPADAPSSSLPQAGGSTSAEQMAEEPDPQTGPGVRRLRQGMVLDYRYHIYNAQLDAATNRPQLQTQMRLFREGQQVFTGKLQSFDAGKQANMKLLAGGGRLRLGPELPPGEYLLQVVVTDTLAQKNLRATTQWMDFEIVK